ncbi:MAG: precorrin-2 C(20)-methyltransferase, partial [Ahrensia sp.]
MTGTLYGIGVGPGAPDLITLRAARVLSEAKIVAYPAPDSGDSFARSIVETMLRPDQIEIPIIVPMRVARFPAAEVYDAAAKTISNHLDTGEDVCVLCEGDPFFYGSFMYLYDRLASRYRCEIVPGVSSVMAASSALGLPLTSRNDVLTVLPGPLDDDELRRHILSADVTVIMKLGRHLPRIRALVDDMGLTDKAYYAERVSIDGQQKLSPLGAL